MDLDDWEVGDPPAAAVFDLSFMPRNDNETRITPSILDRLIDEEPAATREAPKSRVKNVGELKQAVRRDLEWLLNTRCYPDDIPAKLEEVQNSLAIYGLPDFTGNSVKSPSEQKRLIRSMETAIRLFEPRLMNLRVHLEPIDDVERVLRFRIEAQLKVEPTPEPVTFDTVLQMGSGEFEIQDV